MTARPWMRRPPTPSRDSCGAATTCSAAAASSTTGLAESAVSPNASADPAAQSLALPARITVAPVAAPGGISSTAKTSRNANLKIDVGGSHVAITPSGRSSGCFPICGWPRRSTRNPVGTTGTAPPESPPSNLKPELPRQLSPIGSSPHCYSREKASPCTFKQIASPTRRASVFSRMSALRKPAVCEQCRVMLSGDSGAKTASDLTSVSSSPSITGSPPTPTNRCVVCSKASAFEGQLAKAFFSPGLVGGKGESYPGLQVECYRKWFKERPQTPRSVCRSEPKRAAMLTTLQRQHKLHYHKLKDVCANVCTAFAAATGFISVADGDLELIVGNFGSMLHFSCVPREIGMCDFAMGAPEHHLLVGDVASDPVFRENPLLQATKALFYLAVPVLVNGTAIGAVAVMDVSARPDPPDPVAVALMKKTAESMGARVSALLVDGKAGGRLSTRILRRQSRR